MKIIKRVIASALSLCLLPSAAFANGTEDKKETIELALISDSHLFSNTLYADNKYANEAVISETRLELESEAILDKALGEIKAASPDVVLHCGDITSNGEYVNMERVKNKLDALQTNLPDAKICVTNGNHDINNSYAYDFTGEKPVAAKRVLPTDFREIYASYGYGTDSELYKSSGDDQGSLSYVTDIADGITLIALDTCKYSSDTNALYDDAQQTGGELSEELLGWAADKAKSAKAKGNLVLVMCHHALVKHYTIDDKYMNAYMKNFTIDNWEHIADTLADAGVTAVLTGHKHNDDTAKHISPNGNVIYDIATPSLVEYPCAYKTVTLTKNEDGTYDFKTGTHYINNITYTNPAANAEVTIDDLPSYAIEKAGLNKDMIEPAANHLLTAALYSIQQAEGGLGGYLAERLDCELDKVGEVLAEKALKSIPAEGNRKQFYRKTDNQPKRRVSYLRQ